MISHLVTMEGDGVAVDQGKEAADPFQRPPSVSSSPAASVDDDVEDLMRTIAPGAPNTTTACLWCTMLMPQTRAHFAHSKPPSACSFLSTMMDFHPAHPARSRPRPQKPSQPPAPLSSLLPTPLPLMPRRLRCTLPARPAANLSMVKNLCKLLSWNWQATHLRPPAPMIIRPHSRHKPCPAPNPVDGHHMVSIQICQALKANSHQTQLWTAQLLTAAAAVQTAP